MRALVNEAQENNVNKGKDEKNSKEYAWKMKQSREMSTDGN